MTKRSNKRNDKRNDTGAQAALLLLRAYKVYVSPWFAGSCRFEPTCSQYAYQAIERHGLARGAWLALKRLARCQPLSRKFGYDPVPDVATCHHVNTRAEEKSRSFAVLRMTDGGVDRGQEVPS